MSRPANLMPCGWGCGAVLSARQMRKHFAECKRRGMRPEPAPAAAVVQAKPQMMVYSDAIMLSRVKQVASIRGITLAQLVAQLERR